MIDSPKNTCMNCFTQHTAPTNPCPVCGYDELKQDNAPHLLRQRTILNGKYLVGKVLGQGGFGITYIGWDLNLDLKVAIKEYYPTGFVTRETTGTGAATVQPFTGSQGEFFVQGREKFINEAKTLAKFFSLPGIVSVKDYFLENGTAYISMEYIDGETLKDYLAKMGGKLPAEQAFDMIKPVMSSLAEIHNTGIIHRDISPDNIMISKDGYMKLLDFGAARDFTESGSKSMSIMLKPGFAPEEQYRSKGVQGPWTDVYALSATIYKCITGDTPEESVERVRNDEVKPPSLLGIPINPVQEAVLMQGMSVLQNNRFKNMSAMYNALIGVSSPQSSAPNSISAFPVAAGQLQASANEKGFMTWIKSHKPLMIGVLTPVAAVFILGIVWLSNNREAPPAPPIPPANETLQISPEPIQTPQPEPTPEITPTPEPDEPDTDTNLDEPEVDEFAHIREVLESYELDFLMEFSENVNVEFFSLFNKTLNEVEQILGKATEVNEGRYWVYYFYFPGIENIRFEFLDNRLTEISMSISDLFPDKTEIAMHEISMLFRNNTELYGMWEDGIMSGYNSSFYFSFYFINDLAFTKPSNIVSIRSYIG